MGKKFGDSLSILMRWGNWPTSSWRIKFRFFTPSCYLQISTFVILVSRNLFVVELYSSLLSGIVVLLILCFFSIDEEGDKVTISSDDELESAFVFVKRKDGEPFCFIIQTNCGPASKVTTGNCKDCCGVTCNKPPAVLVKPDVNQHCPYKLFMERAKETLNIRPEYLKGLSSIIPSVMEGLGKSNRFYSIVPL